MEPAERNAPFGCYTTSVYATTVTTTATAIATATATGDTSAVTTTPGATAMNTTRAMECPL